MLSGLPHLFPILNKRYYHNANRQCILFAAEMKHCAHHPNAMAKVKTPWIHNMNSTA